MKSSVVTASVPLILGLIATPAAAEPTTTVRLVVKGCEDCVFVAHNGGNLERAWKVVARSTPVSNGRAILSLDPPM
jgi:hypothetical protein